MPPVVGAIAGKLVAIGIAKLAGSVLLGNIVGAVVSFGVGKLLARDDSQEALTSPSTINVNPTSNVQPIPVVYGRRLLAGLRVFGPHIESGDKHKLHQIFVWSEGEIDALEFHRFDDIAETNQRFTNKYITRVREGTDNQTVPSRVLQELSSTHNNKHRLRGVAWSYVMLRFDEDLWSGVPLVTAELRGRLCYDPRDGSTAWSRNPALCIREYLTNTRYGQGIPESDIDDDSFVEVANYCEQQVSTPAGDQQRYRCDGVVSTASSVLSNVRQLLTSCRAMLIWSAGKYRLVADKAETVGFAFTEDNIVGNWAIEQADKRQKFNRVKASFIDKARNWQPNLAIADSANFRLEDNGELLEAQLELPFTTNIYRAQQIAQQELKQSRQGISASFTATIEGLRAEVGDVVSITHTTPGWVAKEFRVIGMRITAEDEVEVSVKEYDVSVYTLDDLEAIPESPDTNLPDPFDVDPPGAPQVSESLFETLAGVRSKAVVTWEAPETAQVVEYQLEYKLSSDSDYTVLPRTAATTVEVLDLTPDLYDFRVKAFSILGVGSDYSTTAAALSGLSAPPTEPQNLELEKVSGLAVLRWDESPDLDVQVGGRYLIRHHNSESGATWETSQAVAQVPGVNTIAIVPLRQGTFLMKAEDSSGVLSTNAATVSTDAATAVEFTNLTTISEHTAFSGTKTDTVVAASKLKLDSGGLVDDITLVDDVTNWDAEGGTVSSGSYEFASGYDATTVKRVRIRSDVLMTTVLTTDLIDSRSGLIDSWEEFDGTAAGGIGSVETFVRQTDDDPAGSPVTWSAWMRFDAAEFEARGFEFKAELAISDPAYNVEVSELGVTIDEHR